MMSVVTVLSLAFVIFFIIQEALPFFDEVSPGEFIFGRVWMPIDFTGTTSFGIFNFIAATVYVSFLAILWSFLVSIGAALWLSCIASERIRSLAYPFIDLLAGIPSVVYGFVGLTVLVKLFMKAGVHTGSCVMAASLLLAVMLLPYLVSSCSESILKAKDRYLPAAEAMGISGWYAIATIVLPASAGNILTAMILAIGRAMGETMAVMMVMGNANLFPRLFGKSETIASVIALEMGTAVAESTHYHALYGAGMVLMILLFVINTGVSALQRKLMK